VVCGTDPTGIQPAVFGPRTGFSRSDFRGRGLEEREGRAGGDFMATDRTQLFARNVHELNPSVPCVTSTGLFPP